MVRGVGCYHGYKPYTVYENAKISIIFYVAVKWMQTYPLLIFE